MVQSVVVHGARACIRLSKILTVFSALWAGILPFFLATGGTLVHVRPAKAALTCETLNTSFLTPPRPPGGAGSSPQDVNFGDFTLNPGDVLTIVAQTLNQGGGTIFIDQVVIGIEGFLGALISLIDGVPETITIEGLGSSPSTGDLVVEITNNVVGAQVLLTVTCVPVGAGADDDDDDDAGDDGAGLGIDGNTASAQVDGTFSITNPETVNGSVLEVFGVNLSRALFEEAIRRQRLIEALEDPIAAANQDNAGNLVIPEPVDAGNDGVPPEPEPVPGIDPQPRRVVGANRLQNPPEQRDEENEDDETADNGIDPCAECRQELADLQQQLAETEGLLDATNREVDRVRTEAREFASTNRLNDAIFELDSLFLTFDEGLLDALAEAGADETPNELPETELLLPGNDLLEFAQPIEVPNAPPGTRKEDVAAAIRDAIEISDDEARGRDINAEIDSRLDDRRIEFREARQSNINSLRQTVDRLENESIPRSQREIRNATRNLERERERLAEIDRQIDQNEAAKDAASADELQPLFDRELALDSDRQSQLDAVGDARFRVRDAEQDLADQQEAVERLSNQIRDDRNEISDENFEETFNDALSNAREISRGEALAERVQDNLAALFFRQLGGEELSARARQLLDQRFDLLDQIDEKEGKLAQCRAENGQASLERDRFQPEHRNIRTAFVNPTPARNAAVSAVGRKRKSAVQRRLTGFNARFNAAARDHDDAQSLEALSFGPRRITSHNGVTAISERAVKARFDLGEWRRDQGRRYGQGASLGERVNPGAEDGRPIIDLPGFFGDARFNLFGSSNITFGENDGVGQDSFSYAVSGGFSYLVLPRLNIGLAGRYQEADVDSAIAEIDADTWGIAAFAQSELPVGGKAIYLEGIVAYSRSDLDSLFNNLGVITTADSITEAFSSQVRASTSFEIERLSISPFLSLSYISTDQASFFLSDGQFAPGAVNDQVTFSSGASLSSSFFLTNTEIELSPSLGLGAFGTVTDGGTVGLSGNGSLGFRSERGIGGGLGVGFSGLTGGTRNLSFSGNISIPLN